MGEIKKEEEEVEVEEEEEEEEEVDKKHELKMMIEMNKMMRNNKNKIIWMTKRR